MANIAVVGATGNVGREVLSIIGEMCFSNGKNGDDGEGFVVDKIFALASTSSSGKHVSMTLQKQIQVQALENFDFEKNEVDIAFFCAGSAVSEKYIPIASKAGCVCIDKSSLYRLDKDVPLIVPEVNLPALKDYSKRNLIATPNCTTIPLTLVLKPLDEAYGLKRVVVTTLQSVSGTGKKAMDELFNQTKGYFEAAIQHTEQDNLTGEVYPKQIAFNCIPQCDCFSHDGFTKEEDKIANETCKIFGKKIPIIATCVRVPVFRCHAEVVNVELEKDFDIEELMEKLDESPSVVVLNREEDGGYAVQCEQVGTDCVFVSRIRRDPTVKYGLSFWLVCDNLRKGAALNGVQIAKELIKLI